MEKLIIEPSKYTPFIEFDPDSRVLEIRGESYPENTPKFYEPVIEWIERYVEELAENDSVYANFGLVYLNTGSSKAMMDFLAVLERCAEKGTKFIVNWYYDETNEAVRECGKKIEDDIVSLTFNLIKNKN